MKTTPIKITETEKETEKEMFDYLNDLRLSGVTNMFGAGSYLANEFEIDKHEANEILMKWMNFFDKNGYEHLT